MANQSIYKAFEKFWQQTVALVESSGGAGGVSNWNDLTDKPFYDESKVLFEWDGNTDGLEYITIEGMGNIYKTSDTPVTRAELIGAEFVGYDLETNEESSEILTEDRIQTVNDGLVHNVDFFFFSVEADSSVDGIDFTRGVWCFDPTVAYAYVSRVSKGVVKQLDIKYIPNELYTEIDSRIDAYINEALGGEY